MNNIPEEIEAMAFLIGQSNQIDSMMMEKNKELVTDANTIKNQLNNYIQSVRQQQAPPPAAAYAPQIQQTLPVQPIQPPVQQIPIVNYSPPQDNNQLELNLDPDRLDVIINLLKDISAKLTKQINLLQEKNENNNKEKRSPASFIELGKNK